MIPEIIALHRIAERNATKFRDHYKPLRKKPVSFEDISSLSQNAYLYPTEIISPLNTQYDARADIDIPEHCPACSCQDLLYLGGVRPIPPFCYEYIPVLYCQNCGTICTPHNVILDLHDPSLAWHLSVESRNRSAARKLFAEVQQYHGRHIQRVLEIGCGPGWLLSELPPHVSSVGYETNPYCVAYGKEKLGLDIRCEMFDMTAAVQFDILFCLSVIEHIENPDELLFSISEKCKKNNATACLFVPFFSDTFMKYIHNTFERVPQNPFWAVPAHVVHYTKLGFLTLLKRFGAYDFQQCRLNGLWGAMLCKFSDTVEKL